VLSTWVFAPDTPWQDFQLGRFMDFLATYMRVDLLHAPPALPSLGEAAASAAPSSSTDLVLSRTCPQGHNYVAKPLLYSGSCNECGGWISSGGGCGHCFECSPTWLLCYKCNQRHHPGLKGSGSVATSRGAGPHGLPYDADVGQGQPPSSSGAPGAESQPRLQLEDTQRRQESRGVTPPRR